MQRIGDRWAWRKLHVIPGGVLLGIFGGVCRPHLQIQTQFHTKKCDFPHPFSDQASKIHTRFKTWPCTWLSIISKFSWNDIFYLFSFLSHQLLALVAGKKNKFKSCHECSPDNHTQFQTKMFKIYTRLQTKTAQKPYPLGAAHTYIPYIGEYPPPRACNAEHTSWRRFVNFLWYWALLNINCFLCSLSTWQMPCIHDFG